METPTQGTSIGTPGHNITFSGYLTVPNETVRIEYRTWNGVWNNLVTTNSSAVASGMGRYEWIVEAQVPDVGWAAVGDDFTTEVRARRLSTGELLFHDMGLSSVTVYASGPEG